MNYRSIADLNRDIISGLHKIPEDVDLIVGVPRSGMLAATILAMHLNLPLIDIDSFIQGLPSWFTLSRQSFKTKLQSDGRAARRALILDDSVNSGNTMEKAKQKIYQANLSEKCLFAAVYVVPDKIKLVDIYFIKLPKPRIFEWNLMHHDVLTKCCIDIDGVLCRDPDDEENDDGPRYQEFLCNVPAWHRPSFEIGWLVTSRLERYRQETEAWLRENGIDYRELIMMDLESAEERRRLGNYAAFKANVYANTDAVLFVESSYDQALEIARLSGRRVLCYETGEMLWPEGIRGSVYRKKIDFKSHSWKQYIPKSFRNLYKKLFYKNK